MISAATIDYLKKGIFTILGIIVATYLFVILLTFTGNDPSWSHISSDMTTINNMGGAMGAWLSDLLYSFFGFGAWWLLAFLIYESILIWWDSKPTFWVLRLVAYVFLLLSASALFAQVVALIQHVTDPLTVGLHGVAGGIVGLELQARLAQLLTKWGNVAFLTVFVIITATFAFNIHWQALYHKLTRLTKFGSGVQAQEQLSTQKTIEDSDEQLQDDSLPRRTDDKDLVTSTLARNKTDLGQLPLELQPQPSDTALEADDSHSRFGHVLTDFLSKSGLGASVKASMLAATEAAATSKLISDNLRPATAMPSNNGANNTYQLDVPVTKVTKVTTITEPNASIRKVEPSFAWNDSGMVDDLLANNEFAPQSPMPDSTTPATESINKALVAPSHRVDQANHYDQPNNNESAYSESAPVPAHIGIETETSAETNISADTDEPQPQSEQSQATTVDKLADSWLAEHESNLVEIEPTAIDNAAETSAGQTIEQPTKSETVAAESVAPVATSQIQEAPELDTKPEPTSQQPASVTKEQALVTDMTPTNTPPADPKAAPTATAKPTMSFAVPDGDSSNHIEDMIPEEDDSPAPTMPEIHDDAAFSSKSRSMQTAQYRAQLTPIPEVSMLDKPDPNREPSYTVAELEQLSELLEIKLQEFNVKASVVNAIPGPVVTRFEVELAAGIKASKVTGISRDLARSLSMASLRVVEVIPGKPYIGIEVPNKQREMVRLIELLDTDKFKDPKAQISMAMGKDIGGKAIITDLARAPHMLVAGTTGSGKSVLVNSMLLSMLLKYTPNELRLILIDPKQLELANYNDIPHLLTPVVTDMTEAASALSWCVAEMERRYQLMSLLKVRKLDEFNKKVRAAEKAGKPMLDPLWRPNDNVSIDQAPKLKTLPMIVIVADEFADMIMQVGKQAEELITRLAQKSRAAGIHLILATQRPSVDVITGLIKANIPVRAALRVNSKVDSRTILDSGGAEDMLGNGDMLFLGPGQIEPDRVHGAYVSDEEVNRVCDAWRERGAPDYIDNMAGNFELSSSGSGSSGGASGEDDDLYNDAVAFIIETRKVSASSIQRKFSIGYNRAARIVDSMEEAGLVSSMGKSGKRELLM
ncbi:DNA translocase FtsK 4TM domain-containing protein [Psychrobacter sp. M13]|uniref:DNA translocase FtsK 4TM domain-containing protein n=1 Tax=Psychrobacter sp. M13 TaxID=3067275 RepID=UPI00273B94DD|nr:DNA translocase FtsK 4TM domain-containing protein [Psychrobacter sp. M13]WLP94999.1 DNA translocase FtsK 4TM domain-containing protein [Psychrobacter sp. M13]